jgi:hypothetical protein
MQAGEGAVQRGWHDLRGESNREPDSPSSIDLVGESIRDPCR